MRQLKDKNKSLFSNLGQEDVPRLGSLADRKIRQTKMPKLTIKTATVIKVLYGLLKEKQNVFTSEEIRNQISLILNIKNELKKQFSNKVQDYNLPCCENCDFIYNFIQEIESVETSSRTPNIVENVENEKKKLF